MTVDPQDSEDRATGRAADIQAQVKDIAEWWRAIAEDDIERTVPKAVEYGAADLDVMGAAMAALLPVEGADDAERAMMGRYAACAFYALGKAARVFGALQQGRLPNPDAEFDLGVYTTMMKRIRQTGRWV